jgi:uncharacterized membrane protein YgcG
MTTLDSPRHDGPSPDRSKQYGSSIVPFAIGLLFMVVSCSTSSGAGTSTPNLPFAAVSQSSGPFGALMVNDNHETLLPMVSRDASGNATGITGALWTSAAGSVAVFVDDNGLPKQTVMGDVILLFSNWNTTANTVDIAAVYAPNSYVVVVKGVRVDTMGVSLNTLSFRPSFEAPRSSSLSLQSTCFPACGSNTENLAVLLKVAGLAIEIGACGAATAAIAAAPVTALLVAELVVPCTGAIINTVTVVTGSEEWLGNAKNVDFILSLADCTLPAPGGCIGAALDFGSKVTDLVAKLLSDDGAQISTGKAFLTNPAQATGVGQQGSGPPMCPMAYECTPGKYMPCYPDGVKQCSAGCLWSSCPSSTTSGNSSGSSTGSSGGSSGTSSGGGSSGSGSSSGNSGACTSNTECACPAVCGMNPGEPNNGGVCSNGSCHCCYGVCGVDPQTGVTSGCKCLGCSSDSDCTQIAYPNCVDGVCITKATSPKCQ